MGIARPNRHANRHRQLRGISGDFNPIHVDHEFAKTTLFGQPIAHGLLSLSVASGLG